jgi:hypothetical protein
MKQVVKLVYLPNLKDCSPGRGLSKVRDFENLQPEKLRLGKVKVPSVRCQLILRLDGKGGEISVTAKSEGLQPGTRTFQSP